MTNKKRLILSLTGVFTSFALSLNISMLDAELMSSDYWTSRDANAESIYPYSKTFSISAYYSPLPGQMHYVTGSYATDIRLNGRGTNGADGTPVYAGMVAAPKSYAFGTKLYIPGIGMTAVHDRGGAIVEAAGDGESGPRHDRLDIWMGYGDKGLTRALNWGLQTVTVTIYGIDDSIDEEVIINGYSPSEKDNQEYFYIPEYYENSEPKAVAPKKLFTEDLWYLSESNEVEKLQNYLKQLGYFKGDVNGYFGDETRMAIYVFQKDKGLVQNIADLGAGHFGPQTREVLEAAILSGREGMSPKVNLGPSDGESDSVKKLQKALELLGYNVDLNGSYDSKTEKAVLRFQIDNDVLDNAGDYGAGYFGPRTLSTLSVKLGEALANGNVKMPVAHANDEIGVMVASRQVLTPPIHENLNLGDDGPAVKRLQQELKNLNLLRIDPTGNYGDVTKHAVFKFQQIHGLVTDKNSQYAGVFGDQTRETMNEIIAEKNYYNKKVSEKRIQGEKVSVAQ
jgi:peptidoglycan hydrolase-like protein with peptidoglycan-binding domain/3D (Asp-Asp-Asp) domain-containing protein